MRHDQPVDAHDLDWSASFHEAGWIESRLAPFENRVVGSIIPTGFPAYARLLHPVTFGTMGERIIRWERVAEWSGLPLERLAHFHDVALPEATPVEVLAGHTPPVDGVHRRCWFCLSAGYGWDNAFYLLPMDAPAQLRANPPRRVLHGTVLSVFPSTVDTLR
jgi:hypothetical protein